jgi:hypothetical protein
MYVSNNPPTLGYLPSSDHGHFSPNPKQMRNTKRQPLLASFKSIIIRGLPYFQTRYTKDQNDVRQTKPMMDPTTVKTKLFNAFAHKLLQQNTLQS